jgi:lipopolysaccharide biosynthesis glycosyltransferase
MKAWIGYDPREAIAALVCEASLKRYCPQVEVRYLDWGYDFIKSVYNRPYVMDHGQYIDTLTGQPFSTQFSFTRFLIPHLETYRGWAAYCDCDFLFRADVRDLFDLADDRFAVMVVPHNHVPVEAKKMDGVIQTKYFRKNWSSMILWNCGHPANKTLTPEKVNTMPGSWLHGFRWLDDADIGQLPEDWNWLVGKDAPISPTTHYRKSAKICAVHMTEGGPWFEGFNNVPYGKEWRAAERMLPQ